MNAIVGKCYFILIIVIFKKFLKETLLFLELSRTELITICPRHLVTSVLIAIMPIKRFAYLMQLKNKTVVTYSFASLRKRRWMEFKGLATLYDYFVGNATIKKKVQRY